MTEEFDWTNLALNDDALVVQLLVDLKQTILQRSPHLPSSSSKQLEQPPLNLEWSVRQRRSKQVCRKKSERASPITPLSWSGGAGGSTSGSGDCGGGFEESSSLPAKTLDTSKVAITNETPTTKRSRRKKTLPELKEEETSLLKEKRNLKNQLATLRSSVENERAMNERLKRLKVDLLSRQAPESIRAATGTDEINLSQIKQIKVPNDSTLVEQISDVCNNLSNNTVQQQNVEGRESSFVLPDLNLPVEDN